MLKNKIKLLIVDDEKDICEFEKAYLEKRDFDVSTVQSGAKAVTLAKKLKPDIALIDIHMGKGITGIEILEKLLKACPECKCIMSTWDKEKALEAEKLGAVGVLIKPAEIQELEKMVSKIAGRK